MNDLLDAASPVVEAPSVPAAAAVVRGWMASAGIRSPHAGHFPRTITGNPALRPVVEDLLTTTRRTHTRLRRRTPTGQGQVTLFDWDVDDVPQLVWPCALPEHLRYSTRPDQRILRAVVAMILVRMREGSPTWAAAGEPVGIPANCAKGWTRYAVSPRFGHRDALVEAATTVAPALSYRPTRHTFRDRPAVVGRGIPALTRAQAPPCTKDFPDSPWCPCLVPELGTGRDL